MNVWKDCELLKALVERGKRVEEREHYLKKKKERYKK